MMRLFKKATPNNADSARYWTEHNVTLHKQFSSVEDSIAYLKWRCDEYPGTLELLPHAGHNGKVILDYGCGPGNDLLGFCLASTPHTLIGADVSSTSLAQARARLDLHGFSADLHLLDPAAGIPLPNACVDYIHCAGVLHHVADPLPILKEFRRVLKPSGEVRMMIYNRDSLWMHLYVAYHRKILLRRFSKNTLDEVFAKSTDGEDCPISRAYRAEEWNHLCAQAGLNSRMIGVGYSSHEAMLQPTIAEALAHKKLHPESRAFLEKLTFNPAGMPIAATTGFVAGINGCYRAVIV